MTIVSSLLIFYGALFLAVGVSVLRADFRVAYENLLSNKGLLWLTGLVTFLIGLVSLLFYREWSGGAGSLITLFGWLTLLKGASILLIPGFALSVYRKAQSPSLLKGAGAIAALLGLLCFYLASM